MPQRKKKGNKQDKRGLVAGPPVNALSYNGPTKLPGSVVNTDTTVLQFGYGTTLQTSGAGLLATVLDAYSIASNSPDWAGLLGGWAEYRILSMRVDLCPFRRYNMATTDTVTPVISVVDRNTNTALASFSAASSIASAEIHPPSTRIVRTVRMSAETEAEWVLTTGSPNTNARLYVKLYSSGNAASLNLYDYLAVVLVQVRGRN
jgi:hypothetical protein